MAYPRIPISKAGKTNRFHSFAVAIAAAVVGPPTQAFDARYSSFGFNLKIKRPIPINEIKWIAICNAENKNKDGAFCHTNLIDPAAPEAAKNICINITPTAVPVKDSSLKNLGNIVAADTVATDISGSAYSKRFVYSNE